MSDYLINFGIQFLNSLKQILQTSPLRCLNCRSWDLSVVAFDHVALEVVVVDLVDNSIHSGKEDEVDMDGSMAVEHEEDSFEVDFLEVALHEVVDSLIEASLDVEDYALEEEYDHAL
nr:hypothetical protein Iba_chr13dCG5640 [Ipomoea batatas]